MEINYSKMRLNIICLSLCTDWLNLRMRQCQISVVSLAGSGKSRNWMWNHIIFWLYTWGCHLTSQTLLWCRCEDSPPWASSEIPIPLLLLCVAEAPVILQSLCSHRESPGSLLFFRPAPKLTEILNFRGLRTALPDGHCHLCIMTKEPWFHQYDVIFEILLETT